jgi:hypothetical protein
MYTNSSKTDAGIVLYFDGSLKLGQLQSVTIKALSGETTRRVNLWLDKSGNGQFFAFNGDEYTGLGGDASLVSWLAGDINVNSLFYGYHGVPNNYYTLAQLQAGVVPGIDGNTPLSLWIGIGGANGVAHVTEVDVQTPEPSALSLLALGGLGLVRRRRRA